MKEQTDTTKAEGVEYTITYREFESVDEAREVWAEEGENPDEVLLGIVNSKQRQNALQNGKDPVREAIKAHGPESDEAREAIESHQEQAYGYIVGRPRGRTSGVTKTAAREFGAKVKEQLGDDELERLAEELGIDLG